MNIMYSYFVLFFIYILSPNISQNFFQHHFWNIKRKKVPINRKLLHTTVREKRT